MIAKLIGEYYERGQFVSASLAANAPTGVHASLKGDPRWPRKLRKAKQTNEVLREMVRDGILAPEPYQRPNRTQAERWMVMRDPSKPFDLKAHGAHSGTR